MPIRTEGTEDHLHFLTLYEDWIRPVLVEHGFQVIRADQIQASGAITQDIVLQLANVDLVVADLTDLNPNVFYELGVRHSLRASGTFMLLDEGRTQHIPFDLAAYRIITYRSELTGIGKLRRALVDFLIAFDSKDYDRRDNPVHDWIPTLPFNAVAAASGSEAGQLRAQLADAHRKIREYEETYGIAVRSREESESPLATITSALQEASQGLLPIDLVRRAVAAANKGDHSEFLQLLARLLQHAGPRLEARDYIQLAGHSQSLGLSNIPRAIYQIARRAYPNDSDLKQVELANYAHSNDPADRDRARQELLSDAGITVEDGTVHLPDTVNPTDTWALGVALDAYHRDGLHGQALDLTSAIVERMGDSTIALRNHGRALDEAGRPRREVLDFYQRSIWCDDRSATSAVWYGNELHNDRRYVDALETYLLACLLDIDDGENFAHVSDELARLLKGRDTGGGRKLDRPLPDPITVDHLKQALVAACSCDSFDRTDLDRCVRAAGEAELDVDVMGLLGEIRTNAAVRMHYQDRARLAKELYQLVRSSVTVQSRDDGADSVVESSVDGSSR
jgi:hypothetical protein